MNVVTIFFLSAALLLSACGFRPVYGDYSRMETERSSHADNVFDIEIANISNREGQYLRNDLVDRLNYRESPVAARYRLTINGLRLSKRDLDLTKSSENTRSQIVARAELRLIDQESRAVVLSRPINSNTAFNVLPSEYATNVTENNARQEALRDLARQVETQIALFFNRPVEAR